VPRSCAQDGRAFLHSPSPPRTRRPFGRGPVPPGASPRGCAIACFALSLLATAGGRAQSSEAPDEADGGTPTSDQAIPAAQANPTAQPMPVQRGAEVEIVASAPEGSTRAPAAQSTVIDVSRFAGEARSVAELLGSSPGVAVHAAGGPGQTSTFSLRGASADESLLLLDGIPLQGPGGGAVDLATLPASLLSRIVVSRGVLGAQLGAGALGGAVELIPRASSEKPEGGAQLSVGSYGTAALSADMGGPAGARGGWTGAVDLSTTQGNYSFARQLTPSIAGSPYVEDERQNADARRAAGLLRWSGRPSDSTRLDVLLLGGAGARGLPGAIGAFTPRARAADENAVAGVGLRGLEGAVVWAVRAWGRADRIDLTGVGAGAGDCVPGAPGCEAQISRSYAARGEAEVGMPAGALQWLTLSASGGEDWIVSTGAGRERRVVASLAAADEVRLAGGVLSLHPAFRLDRVGELWGVSPALAATVRPWLSHAGDTAPLARVLAGIELRAGVGRSFRPASFAELHLDQGTSAPNPSLEPERATSIDAGIAYRSSGLLLSAGGFWSTFQDLIIYEQFPPLRVKPFNIGAARIAGIELQAAVQLPAGFTVEAAYSYLDAINRRPIPTQEGQKLAYRPPQRLFLRAARRGDRWEGFLELSATASMLRNSFGTARLPAQKFVNAGAGARVFGPLWLDVEVRNALDDQTLQDLFQYPLPGLTVTALARVRL
jgi:vitamin B12 transporter